MKARELIVAPRMPARMERVGTGAFDVLGDVVGDCAEPGCGWHAMGPRQDVKHAWEEHRRLYHSTEVGVVLLNTPRQ